MEISNKTVLITGGGSGIGLETARLLNKRGNKVLIIGRNADRLRNAARGLDNVHTFSCDITKGEEVKKLTDKITNEFENLSIVMNNAAQSYVYSHGNGINAFEKASEEMLTNYLAVIRLNESLLPILTLQKEAAIINVTSLVSITPVTVIPTYSDTKAALHSYTLALRHSLAKNTPVKVFELLPPLVDTEFSKAIGGAENGIPAVVVAEQLLEGIQKDEPEIYVGQTKDFRSFFFSDPQGAFQMLNPTH
ncbi:uncharacterized oxidoreductase [Filimonas lacunae]|uniref:Uncharacterized oxidoreductase n=1 Tax=Filimonas lacunae TaxID=477680 RepID=A0A173MBK9_9BACT|nr:SDR family NAD(P)-dependent oxidoreductase [Filimonas lacunae]BAV04916.1 dehydrogenase protein DltE [Filimonas lacunae]SIT33806.1 uncharacterized oxidoreductase [Filimonas lacunae]